MTARELSLVALMGSCTGALISYFQGHFNEGTLLSVFVFTTIAVYFYTREA